MGLTFSVITPSFQQGDFIERTIQSVLTQVKSDSESTSPIEIDYVVCDGGSSDQTVAILQRYGSQLRWISERDRGQADAVNTGIAMTTGDIIAWINSDDVYFPGAFAAVQAVFAAHPEVAAVYGNADWIDDRDQLIAPFPTRPWHYDRLPDDCYLCQPAVFFRRSLVEKFGNLDIRLNYCLDYELWLRYGQHVAFHYLPQKLAGSRMYATNKTLGQRLKAHAEVNEMLLQKLGYVPHSWLCGYALVKVEETNGLDRTQPAELRPFAQALIVATLQEYRHRQQPLKPIVLLKLAFWWLLPQQSWFMRSLFRPR